MGIRQTGSGSAFWLFSQFFKQILFLFFTLFNSSFLFDFFWNCLLKKERKGRKKRRRRIQGQSKCLRLVNGESRANVSKQTTAVTHSWGDAHQHMWAGRRKKTVAETKIKMRGKRKQGWGNMLETDAQTHTRATHCKTCNLTKSPPQTSKCTARAASFICQHVRSHVP